MVNEKQTETQRLMEIVRLKEKAKDLRTDPTFYNQNIHLL
jgi:hypothetical protein